CPWCPAAAGQGRVAPRAKGQLPPVLSADPGEGGRGGTEHVEERAGRCQAPRDRRRALGSAADPRLGISGEPDRGEPDERREAQRLAATQLRRGEGFVIEGDRVG